MDSDLDITFSESAESRLLSESSLTYQAASGSGGGSGGGDDLSLSDLSLSDKPLSLPPFSLLAQRPSYTNLADSADPKPQTTPTRPSPEEATVRLSAVPLDEVEAATGAPTSGKRRDDRLRTDLSVLRKLNDAFSSFNEALDATSTANNRIASQLAQTDQLLNKYVGILSKSENYARLLLDERWQGAVADEEEILQEARERRQREEAQEKAAQEAREQALREKELEDRRIQAEAEKTKEKTSRGGIRGVRGNRASMRGQASRGRGSVSQTSSAANNPTGIRRPSSAMGSRGTGSSSSRGRR